MMKKFVYRCDKGIPAGPVSQNAKIVGAFRIKI